MHDVGLRVGCWWAREDSNLRPIGYEPTALPLSYGPSPAGVATGGKQILARPRSTCKGKARLPQDWLLPAGALLLRSFRRLSLAVGVQGVVDDGLFRQHVVIIFKP